MNERGYIIVVGVDGSAGGRKALRWAVNEAQTRGGSVQAVMAWQWEFPELRREGTDERAAGQARQQLEREIESIPAFQRCGVPIAAEVVTGKTSDVLAAAARGASLLVLGSHGHSRQVHRLLGSVTEECIRQARCPVVVLPAASADTDIAGSAVTAGQALRP